VETINRKNQLERIIETIAEGVTVISADGRIVFVNAAAEEVLGLKRDDIIGRAYNDPSWKITTVEGNPLPEEERPFIKVMKMGVSLCCVEYGIERPDGMRIIVSVNAKPFRDEKGNIIGVINTFSDITERKRFEEALRTSEANYRAIFDAANDAIYVHDMETGQILDVNRKMTEMYGYTLEEARQLNVEALSAGKPPFTQKDAMRWIRKAVEGEPQIFEWMAKDKAGRLFWVEVSLKRAVIGGKDRLLAIVRDIGERKQVEEALKESERRFREMLEKVRLVAVMLDDQGNIVFANDYLLDLTGWEREEVIGRKWFDIFIPAEQREEIKQVFKEVKVKGLPAHYDNDILTREGGRRTISFNNVFLRDPQGNVIGTASIGEDITEQKLAAKEIRESRRQVLDILESITDGFFALDNQWRLTYLNHRAEQLLGKRREEVLFRDIWEVIPEEVGARFYKEYHRAKEEMMPALFEAFYQPQGRWFEVRAYPYRSGMSVYLSDITERKKVEEEQRREKELSDALNDINADISSTLDFSEIMRRVVAGSAKAIGVEVAAIDLREDDYWVVKYLYGLPKELIGTRFTDEEAKHSAIAAKTRKPFVSNDTYSDERLSREIVEKYNLRSLLVVPLVAREAVIGVLFFSYSSAPVAFTDAEVDFAGKLATSVSLAIENARLYSEERKYRKYFQQALLTMPQKVEGIDFGYTYHFATEATKIGGDFYDLFELEHGRVGIVVGDVSGKGMEAVVLTSLVKNTIKAYAYEGGPPSLVMSKTNDLIRKTPISGTAFITVFFGILDIMSGVLTYCSAGHPPAILKRKTSETLLLITSSPVIGAFAGLNYIDDEATLEKDDALILYTDGVTEARCDGEFFGEEKLVSFIMDLKLPGVKELPQVIFNEVMECTGGKLTDDVVIFTVALV